MSNSAKYSYGMFFFNLLTFRRVEHSTASFIYRFPGSATFPAESICNLCESCCNVHRNIFLVHGNRTISGSDIETYCEIPPCTLHSTNRFSERIRYIRKYIRSLRTHSYNIINWIALLYILCRKIQL